MAHDVDNCIGFSGVQYNALQPRYVRVVSDDHLHGDSACHRVKKRNRSQRRLITVLVDRETVSWVRLSVKPETEMVM